MTKSTLATRLISKLVDMDEYVSPSGIKLSNNEVVGSEKGKSTAQDVMQALDDAEKLLRRGSRNLKSISDYVRHAKSSSARSDKNPRIRKKISAGLSRIMGILDNTVANLPQAGYVIAHSIQALKSSSS